MTGLCRVDCQRRWSTKKKNFNKYVWSQLMNTDVYLSKSVQFSSFAQSCPTLRDAMDQCQASLSINNSQSPPKPISIESVMPSNHLILCRPLLLPPSIFPSIRIFQWVSSLPHGQSIGVSASTSVLLMNIQDWFPLGWTGWTPCSPRDSQESSPTPQFKSINSSALSFLYSPALTSIHDYWKNHSLD